MKWASKQKCAAAAVDDCALEKREILPKKLTKEEKQDGKFINFPVNWLSSFDCHSKAEEEVERRRITISIAFNKKKRQKRDSKLQTFQ